ncbi:MAG: hypothetical protein MSG64_13325 [Pyrinomonadaceae bacterium MAG19_C2-C3]|nr:hypothetical protein [Pyrinomonadaceae bacterium MAG19_C2-C3]
MDWMNQLSGLLNQYQGGQNQQQPNNNVDNDFDQLSRAAPNSAVAEGLSAAFRSNNTPPFGNMVSQLFANSSGTQRASLMNTLLAAAGPMVLQQVMSRMGGGGMSNAGGGLAGLLGNLGGGGQPQVTPEMAEQIPPQAIEQIAAEAEKQDPSIIDRVSGFYAENPDVVKGLGAVALTVALAHLANRHLNK